MAEIKMAEKARLVIALMYKDQKWYDNAIIALIDRFGKIELESKEFKFSSTDYYKKEFGVGLAKRFISFKRLIDKDELPGIKIYSNWLEKEFMNGGKRTVNIDPSYITNNQLVVASAKEKFHRIYIGKGIYGQLMLAFGDDKCADFDWTYCDYKENKEFFLRVRDSLKS